MAYGGQLLTTRKARKSGRPLSTKHTMHLVLRSTKAVGDWSFRQSKNRLKVESIISNFSVKYGIQILSLANVGNHIHIHMRLSSRFTYRPFIRAITAAIAMTITGINRWNPSLNSIVGDKLEKFRFWDRRPFTRIVVGRKSYLNLTDYVKINQFEALGGSREQARILVAWKRSGRNYG